MATTAGLTQFKRVYENPESVMGGQYESRMGYYRLLWAQYNNSMFDDIAAFASYRAQYKLYRMTRSIYNPTRRLVDFYASQIYPGVLSEDGSELPEGIAIAIPFADDTPPLLKSAIAQFWQWTNWQSGKSDMLRYGACTGDVLVEVVDDLDRQKVTANVVWPGLVAALQLDSTGNVKAYALEYKVIDEGTHKEYTFRKEVDDETIRFFKDQKPFDYYGEGAEVKNPYSFVPAVWVKHRSLGGDHGAPAIHGSMGKIDELNSLASHIHDQIHKVIGAPVMLWSAGAIANLVSGSKRGATDELAIPEADRESVLILRGPQGGHVESLAGDLDLSQAMPYLDSLIKEIEQDHPELAMYRELRAMSQVSGPGAARMMGDVGGVVGEVAANYDQQSVKLFQMAVAIAGWRLSRGDWRSPLTRQQEKFRGFDLDSYNRGDLDFAIMPRPLIPLTEMEKIAKDRAQLSLQTDQQAQAAGPAIGGADQDAGAIERRLRAGIR